MTNMVKKHSLSSELAQKMVDKAVAKTREIGISENAASLHNGSNERPRLRESGPGARIPCVACRTESVTRAGAVRREFGKGECISWLHFKAKSRW
jgi:hypothetical protein